ncbi:DUF86 domain-containing protein [Neobacillus terrae]|uniref:DUF86 domain-containing protein n=1 Tax=Neobacillus terrae TaxID=3034837 RepID=UPI001407C4D2|nr:DUF86 domain-containing protein [Neobacillus terrae]NHM32794.1 DUF86 domain-containing protein [Neobacillus terrae]
MYFVDRNKIEEILSYLEELIRTFSEVKNWEGRLEKAALERLTQMMIESILDVGNLMIDGFIMRDPGSYEDIIDILMDEKVVSEEIGCSLKTLILFRKILVQSYTEISHNDLADQFSKRIQDIHAFADHVRKYLIEELGPVSAFKN